MFDDDDEYQKSFTIEIDSGKKQYKQQEDENNPMNLSAASHPIVCLIHIAFKAIPIFCYLFLKLLTGSSVYTFISVILLKTCDFWFVKNVGGRILVGLRWWNGEEEIRRSGWVFESRLYDEEISAVDSYVFWWTLSISTAVWGIFFLLKLLSLSLFWGMLAFICFVLNLTNLYAYYLCRKDHQEKLKRFMNSFGKNYKSYIERMRDSFSRMERQ